ncbi:uncharacterized protein Tco025E_04234, partial [Trypanosoma conorhini]
MMDAFMEWKWGLAVHFACVSGAAHARALPPLPLTPSASSLAGCAAAAATASQFAAGLRHKRPYLLHLRLRDRPGLSPERQQLRERDDRLQVVAEAPEKLLRPHLPVNEDHDRHNLQPGRLELLNRLHLR